MAEEASERAGVEMLRVRDIMVHPVHTVDPRASVCALVRLLVREQISGAPVVDGKGKLVGVVSTSDVLRLLSSEGEVPTGDPLWEVPGFDGGAEEDALFQRLFEDAAAQPPAVPARGMGEPVLDATTVGDIMTAATFTIPPDASMVDLARFLAGGRIHRCLVVEKDHLLGIVTSSDVVRAIGCGSAPRF